MFPVARLTNSLASAYVLNVDHLSIGTGFVLSRGTPKLHFAPFKCSVSNRISLVISKPLPKSSFLNKKSSY